MILDDPYQEPTPEQIEKMREWYDSYVVPRIGTEFFFVSGGRMATTKDKNNMIETFMRDDHGQGFTHQMHSVVKYYSWLHIIAFIFYTLILILAYVYVPSARNVIFGYCVGTAAGLTFRPWAKRWKYTKLSEEYKPFVSPHSEMPYKAQYMNDPTTIHNERIDGH